LFEPSTLNPQERDQWIRATKRSIDFCAQVKAQVLVCHLGSIRFFWFNPVRKIRRHTQENAADGYAGDEAFLELKDSVLGKLRKRMPPYLAALKSCIGEVLAYAKQHGVTLGFENREKMEELPLDADFSDLLASFPADAPVGYWHDTGHAHIKERLALLKHREHLAGLAPRLLGFHLHDVSTHGSDHQAIGTGRIDFDMVSSFWRSYHKLVLELSPRLSVEEVVESRRRINQYLERSSEISTP
jgi:sugar phosphate isomerase/epimerase